MLKQVFRRAVCLLTAAVLTLPLMIPAVPAAQSGDTVVIRTVSDLLELAENCTLDTWSQDKLVRLEADLDLSGSGFAAIPTFGGTFIGNNHTISGLSITADGSHQGLFRYLQPGGQVENLTVRGTVAPGGSAEQVGGIVGCNRGTLSLCSFTGTVKGSADVGGIVGVNEATGRVTGCTSIAAVSGKLRTGGVAGKNAGILLSCTNRGGVNVALADQDFTLEELDTGSVLEEPDSSRPGAAGANAAGRQDTGGIAGYSSGIIQSCSNSGSVGYAHVGYNVGGVAGRQTGLLSDCSNSGHILGRKDVGGIAGQSEPDVLISDSSALSDIRAASDRLSELVDRAISHADRSAGDISARLSEIGSRADSTRDDARDLLDRTDELLGINIDAVNDLSVTLTGALDRISPALEDLSDAAAKLEELTEKLGPVMDRLADASGDGRQLAGDLDRAIESLQTAVRRARTALEQMKSALSGLRGAVVGGDSAGTDQALADLAGGASELAGALDGVAGAWQELADSLAGGADLEVLQEAFQAVAESVREVAAAAGTISGALSGLKDLDFQFENLSGPLGGLSDAIGTLSGAGDSLQTALDRLRRSAGDLSAMGGALQDAFRQLGDLSGDAGQTAGLLSSSADRIKDAVDYLRRTGPITLTPADDAYRAAGDRLFDDLAGVSDAMKDLNDSVTGASGTLLADLRAINRQFNILMDLVLDALIDLQDGVEDDRRVQDTSEENAAAQTQGKVERCTNSGFVEGDRNVGGILGSMAIEYTLNPEDDGLLDLSFGTTYETRSVVLSCVNQGSVAGKKDCVGGVVGRMDLGYLSECQNYGDVESTGGSYVGGIAGQTASTLEKSYAKCTLSGESFVGGIAGCGGTVRGCAAICLISNAAECLGAVTGYADELDDITENYYIDTGVGGVDGVSYAGHAQSAELSFLQALENVPAEFTAFRLILRSDGRVIQTIPFTFGQRLSRVELPDPPEKEGFFGVWPTPEDDTPRSDVILDVEYTPWLTVVSSTQTVGDRPVALVDGQFTSQAVLDAADSAGRAPAGASPEAKVWDVTLTGTGLEDDAVLSLRLLCPGGGTVRVYRDGGWQELDAQVNGSYLIVEMRGTSETFCVEPAPAVPIALIAVIAAAALAVLLLLVLMRKLVKKRRNAKAAGPSEQDEEQVKEPVEKN